MGVSCVAFRVLFHQTPKVHLLVHLCHIPKFRNYTKDFSKITRRQCELKKNKKLGCVIEEGIGCLDPRSSMPCKMTTTSVSGEGHVGYCENALYLQEDEYGKQVSAFYTELSLSNGGITNLYIQSQREWGTF